MYKYGSQPNLNQWNKITRNIRKYLDKLKQNHKI